MVDSNLNIIRKKTILTKYPNAALYNCIGYNDGALLYGSLGFVTSPPQATLVRIDTFLNIMKKPSVTIYTDSLCGSYPMPEALQFPTPDTIAFEDLNLRQNIFVGLQSIKALSVGYQVYPNPSNGYCKIQFNNHQTGEVLAYNNLGQLVYQTKFINCNILNLDLPSYINGLIYLHINTDAISSTKIMVIDRP